MAKEFLKVLTYSFVLEDKVFREKICLNFCKRLFFIRNNTLFKELIWRPPNLSELSLYKI